MQHNNASNQTSTINSPETQSLIFFPRYCEASNGLEPTKVDVDGAEIGGLWLERKGSDGVLLFFHGNGEVAADWSSLAESYASALNVSVWFVDYRGYGRSTGAPSYNAMLADAECIFNALADRESAHGSSFCRRFVFGRSIGSVPAIHLAWRFSGSVDALIVDSGLSHITELVRRFRERRNLPGGAPDVPEGFLDNIDKLKECAMPTLFLHGAEDTLIPISEAQENYRASAAAVKRIVEIPGAGHNDLIFRARQEDLYFGAIRSFAWSVAGMADANRI